MMKLRLVNGVAGGNKAQETEEGGGVKGNRAGGHGDKTDIN